jgi:CubicO group peptidase (beta-lactamase class C family)
LGLAYDRAMQDKVFGPLGMTATTFDEARAMATNWAEPHADGIDGRPALLGPSSAATGLNRSIKPYRPAGGAWSTANDLIKFVRFELNEGRLDDGTQHVSPNNLLQRRLPTVATGEDRAYGMGLRVDRSSGMEVIHHGGSMFGYKSDMMFVPSAGIGAVILTNSNNGSALLRPFMRRLLELLFDGRLEAADDVAAQGVRSKAELQAERARVSVVPDPAAITSFATAYTSVELGPLNLSREGKELMFNFRSMKTPIGTRRNDDGSISAVALDPALLYFPLVIGSEGDKPTLTVRDNQHEYKFIGIK